MFRVLIVYLLGRQNPRKFLLEPVFDNGKEVDLCIVGVDLIVVSGLAIRGREVLLDRRHLLLAFPQCGGFYFMFIEPYTFVGVPNC